MKQGAGVLLIKDGKVLLVKAGIKSKQPTGQISFPGGTIEEGESEEQAARREFTEETGLTAGALEEFPGNRVEGVVKRKDGEAVFGWTVFLTDEYQGELRATEETEPLWADLDEAQKMPLYGKNNQILDDAIKFLHR
ncbi:MAG: NUDIX domain-containing protein [Candidatus Doudnabacteria bacterium]|nr:NUDIX domain-containing protein [Candidatus Doudnabacteria bacterium]